MNEACGCCDGVTTETPQELANRGGLSTIAYRIGHYAHFRASLHASLSSSAFAPLAKLRTRDADDFTIGLIDAFACATDVLTFYQERIANESYLRTATERISLQEMGKLIGYRLRPGVAAETWLAFAMEAAPEPPASLPPEPGNFVTGVPESVSIDVGIKVQSVPGEGELPQTFETVEALTDVRAAWNAMRPWMTEAVKPAKGDVVAYFTGVNNGLRTGDALLFLGDEYLAGTNPDNWESRIVASVEAQPAFNRTLVTWQQPLNVITQALQVHVMRRRAAVYGHNAPMWRSLSADFRIGYAGQNSGAPDWPDFTLSTIPPTPQGPHVDLDTLYPEIQPGGYVMLANNLYKVGETSEASRAEFALSGKITRLQLVGSTSGTLVRNVSVFAASELLTLAEYPVDGSIRQNRIPVAVSAKGLLPGRRIIVRGTPVKGGNAIVHRATLVAALPVSNDKCTLEITPPLPDALARSSIVVFGNVVLASHGESVAQILGSGDGSQIFQRFQLNQTPLTYRAAANELGAASELTVRVGDIAWTERPTMYGASETERAYTITRDEQGRDFVLFGDGVNGARLPTGVTNIRATYRKGIGTAGNVAAEKLTQLTTRPLALKSVSNPLAAEGGTDPESSEAARQSIPLGTRTLGRAVSLLDYEDFARAFSGIAKAQARVLQLPAGTTIAIAIAATSGAALTPASPVWINLLSALRTNSTPHVAVMLLAYESSTFRVGLKVKRDPAYAKETVFKAVEAALRAHYAFDARNLGQPVQQSDVIAVVQAVPGVVAVDITQLDRSTQQTPSKQSRLLASQMRVVNGMATPVELLTLDAVPIALEDMP